MKRTAFARRLRQPAGECSSLTATVREFTVACKQLADAGSPFACLSTGFAVPICGLPECPEIR